MNFKLTDIELHFGGPLISAATKLLHPDSFDRINNSNDKDCSTFFLSERASTQISLLKGKVRKYNCDCTHFKLYSKCRHVAALTLMVRKINTQTQSIQYKDPEVSFLSTRKILENIDNDALVRYLNSYLKNDPELNAALRSRFVFHHKEDGWILGRSMLSNAISKYQNAKRPNDSSLFHIIRTIENFFFQVEDFKNILEFTMSYDLVKLICHEIKPLLVSKADSNGKISEFFGQAYHIWTELQYKIVAPEIRHEIAHHLVQQIHLIPIISHLEWHKTLETCLAETSRKYKGNEVDIDELLDKLKSHSTKVEIWLIWLKFIFLYYSEKADWKKLAPYLPSEPIQSEIIRGLLNFFIETDRAKEVFKTSKYLLNNTNISESLKEELQICILKINCESNQEELALMNAKNLYLQYKNTLPLEWIFKYFPLKFDDLVANCVEKLNTDSDELIILYIRSAAIQKKWDTIYELLGVSMDINLIQEFDGALWKVSIDQTSKLYLNWLEYWQNNFFGEPARAMLNEVYVHLQLANQYELVKRMRDEVRSKKLKHKNPM